MNNLQKVASAISGYEGPRENYSAQDDGYYELIDMKDKIECVRQISANLEDTTYVSEEDAIKIINFLDFDNEGQLVKTDYAFKELNAGN